MSGVIIGVIAIIVGIVFAFFGTLSDSLLTVITGGAVAGLGITMVAAALGTQPLYASITAVVIVIAAWITFWKMI